MMMEQKINTFIENKSLAKAAAFVFGLMLMAALAQVKIVLPFTPVPITGQSMGSAIIALSWSSTMAPLIIASYILLGVFGLPVFAGASSFALLGPTAGYLLGMLVSAYVMPKYLEITNNRSLKNLVIASLIGKVFVFGLGLAVLSFYIPSEGLLVAGLLPFIPGDILKTIISLAVVKSIK